MYDVDDFISVVLGNTHSLDENKKALLSSLDPSVRSILKRVDFAELCKDFEESLWELFQRETPPTSTKIIHFGLRESADGCSLYVVGTKNRETPEFRDSEEWDWVGPHGGCLHLPVLCTLWESLSGSKEEEWEVVLAVVMIILRTYLCTNAEAFLSMSGLASVKITAGFDEGDLYELPLDDE